METLVDAVPKAEFFQGGVASKTALVLCSEFQAQESDGGREEEPFDLPAGRECFYGGKYVETIVEGVDMRIVGGNPTKK